MKAMNLRRLEAYQAANLEAARRILADPEQYPAGSLLPLWAELIFERSGMSTTVDPEPVGPLFNTERA
jgi:hypothetical protein